MNKGGIAALASTLALSAAGFVFLADQEDIRLQAYPDAVGIPTICMGHTDGVKLGQRASFRECNRNLLEDAGVAGQAVARCTHVAITQEQYDALVSFALNTGGAAYCGSTLAKRLNAGDCWGAGAEFSRWVYAGGKRLPGLAARRAAERQKFETGCQRSAG